MTRRKGGLAIVRGLTRFLCRVTYRQPTNELPALVREEHEPQWIVAAVTTPGFVTYRCRGGYSDGTTCTYIIQVPDGYRYETGPHYRYVPRQRRYQRGLKTLKNRTEPLA